MNEDFNSFLDSADAEFDGAPKRKTSTEERFPCGQCHGTGRYQGARVHQEKAHCFACRGTGFFKTDPRKLEARRVSKATSAANAKAQKRQAFAEAHPEMSEELARVGREGSTNGFISSLAAALEQYGSLTENQIAAWYRGRAKLVQIQEARATERQASQVQVDLTPIRSMFETAVGNGYKKPTYRAEGLILSRAPDTGSNPGALYVKSEDDAYLGKILGTTFHPTRDGRQAGETLLAIAIDPLAAALRYGQRTGRCACCGRELTKHTSIDAGIGPICKEKWGL